MVKVYLGNTICVTSNSPIIYIYNDTRAGTSFYISFSFCNNIDYYFVYIFVGLMFQVCLTDEVLRLMFVKI